AQPSRAEGFGLVPLEARVAGVPVVTTACTGHQDHVTEGSRGVVIVDSGADAPIDDGPGAMAPAVRAASVADALRVAYRCRGDILLAAREDAPVVLEQHSWEAVTRRALEHFRTALC